jgi:4-hydroxythreonine-4-phosphate dehydrogenase
MKERLGIGITMGDPAGIGPELCLRALQEPVVLKQCTPIVFGDAGVLRRVAEAAKLSFSAGVVKLADWEKNPPAEEPIVVDCGAIESGSVLPGMISAECGGASFNYIKASIGAAVANRISGVVTAPVHKEALRLADVPYPGHTEIFAALTGADRVCMMLTSEALTVSMVTTHIGYASVPKKISPQRVQDVIELTDEAMKWLKSRTPRLGICGLNPHAGEHGLFGEREEENLITPAIERARAEGIQIEGPLPPDAAFVPHQREKFDAIVCLYHDQGHIPFKMLAFDTGVNITIGLPIIRTSVDHGTAFDIAWKGKADPQSLFKAIDLAVRLAKGKGGGPQCLVNQSRNSIRAAEPWMSR